MSEAHKATSFSGTSCQTPILVTGATGFLGGYVARRLQAGGAAVRALGRHLARGQQLQSEGIAFYPVDLRDREAVTRVCAGVAAVVHAGALSSAWGLYQDFYDCNVRGTEHVIEGCLRHGVRRLVYISSPSVLSRLTDQHDLDECAPFPPSFVSVYSETKKLGEDRVRAVRNKLETVILRPKAIYGPGDNALLPRLIDAARRGRLPIIGDGNTVTEVTHVDDVVQAVLLALEKPEAAGQTFLITSGEDTRIWDLIRDVTLQLGYAPPAKRLPVRKALLIAAVMEGVWRGLRLPGEPLLTRYKAGILGYSQTYSIDKARRELGYCPKVTLKAGMPGALAALATEPKHMGGPVVSVEVRHGRQTHFRAPCPAPASGQGMAPSATPEGTLVKLRMLKAGSTHAPEKVFTPYGRWRWIYVPAMFALLEHPSEGVGLVDVGYAPRFFEATRRWPYRIFRWLTPAAIPETESPVVQLRQRGIGPEEVRWILISHFDPDHIGGLIDFPAARLYCSVEAFASIRGK
ncbi:MAG: NAD-dependent epimerase/dehydratase family protein, partial [Candidatus Hydrogenedentes bacterium]|nr:NAD-dependent epimerase/dehydratase family protein [Candidatus Hydrogenedentota bacterium]